MLLPSSNIHETSQSFQNSQLLFRRADFNLFSRQYQYSPTKVQRNKDEAREQELEVLASRPRRKSIDALMPESQLSNAVFDSTHMVKQKVVAHLQSTEQLNSEIHDIKLQNQFLQRKLNEANAGKNQTGEYIPLAEDSPLRQPKSQQ